MVGLTSHVRCRNQQGRSKLVLYGEVPALLPTQLKVGSKDRWKGCGENERRILWRQNAILVGEPRRCKRRDAARRSKHGPGIVDRYPLATYAARVKGECRTEGRVRGDMVV